MPSEILGVFEGRGVLEKVDRADDFVKDFKDVDVVRVVELSPGTGRLILSFLTSLDTPG